MNIEGVEVKVSNPDKELYDGVTKRDVVEYYVRAAPRMLPWLEGRPLSLRRFPEGIDESGFFQKNTPDYVPDFVERIVLRSGSGETRYAACANTACLAYLGNLAAIELHPWLSRQDRIEQPDMLIFDLDPPDTASFDDLREAAVRLRDLIEDLGMRSFPKLTGSRGIHLVVPLSADEDFTVSKRVTRTIAEVLARAHPDSYTVEHRKAKRDGRIFIDYLRNEHGQTAIAPYSLRAKPGAPVAMPIAWDELDRFESDTFMLGRALERLEAADPWEGFWDERFSLSALKERIASLG